MKFLLIGMLLMIGSQLRCQDAFEPEVRFANGRIIASPPKGISVLSQRVQILRTTSCAAKVDTLTTVQIPERCEFLQGIYQIVFRSRTSPVKEHILTDFSITVDSSKRSTFLLGEYIRFDENDSL